MSVVGTSIKNMLMLQLMRRENVDISLPANVNMSTGSSDSFGAEIQVDTSAKHSCQYPY